MADTVARSRQVNLTRSRRRNERLEARISKEQKEVFQRAAEIQGRTLTDFVINSVMNAAKQIIQEHEMIILSRQDQEVFVEALLNPPEPSAKLKTAAQRYKQNMGV
ncbi:DUF1778 domain-containing protein [Nostocaceae cyanobacterium CENA357]|uniref:DUF1778 domain-containing protein n=1 Tax=Atlanticothrix silvestris CENA357 TaxID=1725252 RepID=A0A8J7L3B2_9CYAN|nr:DUF1778 domain-containing protein [Atlanticothrix silvestris]MBH8554855.1 DUF1778 domain-containing protein [Atlanticothrix silvestris CENA357]